MLAHRVVRAAARMSSRSASSASALRQRLGELVPQKQDELKKLKDQHGKVVIGHVTVDQCIGGGRDVKCMYWDTSLLDAEEGIRFRGHTIPELQEKLPKVSGGAEPLPEGLLWLLMTGEVPTPAQAASVAEELKARAGLSPFVRQQIRSFPRTMHPMSQLSSAVVAMQTESKFAKAYRDGAPKGKYADFIYEDVMNLLANLPEVAATIYRCSFHDGKVAAFNKSLDYSANFNRMLGFSDPNFDELMRLYLVIHSDHEGGNASAHTTRLVGSTLSDPYLSFAAGMNALAGPLHGLANQEVLRWILDLQAEFAKANRPVNHDTIRDFAWSTLKSGKVIPGYGHAVLRRTDPRYTAQREFALKFMPEDPLFKIVSMIFEVVPDVLTKQGKTKNPWPNVDAHSGVLLRKYGLTEFDFYTVLFGVSRGFGVLSQLFWDRALGLPLERPKSVTGDWIRTFVAKNQKPEDD